MRIQCKNQFHGASDGESHEDTTQMEGIPLTGFAHLTLTARLVVYADADDGLPPDTLRHQFTSTILNNSMGMGRTPDRVWSPGFCLGMELARLGKVLRFHFADADDVVKGFAYEMKED